MRFVDECKDPAMVRMLTARIARLCEAGRPYTFMEVCGGHTQTIDKPGIEDCLPPNLTLVHGPGCPVCVLPRGRVDDAIHLAEQPGVIMTLFGNMLRVPGSQGSFLDAKARGADIRMVYSPLEALKIARQHPDKQVVFMAIGFETTAPSTALTLLQAVREGVPNFSIFCNHVIIMPAIQAILESPDLRLDGIIGPGHVSTVIGCRPYEFIARDFGKPVVVAGCGPLDMLQAVSMLLEQLARGRHGVENLYGRMVPWDGNLGALQAIHEVMELRPAFEWRGLGCISHSALQLRAAFACYDAERRFEIPGFRVADPKVCSTACTPETPFGPCMVASAGTCAACSNYGRFTHECLENLQTLPPRFGLPPRLALG
jgi:hydrogenase expression/formation protein HypD